MSADCGCGLEIFSSLPYVNGSYELEYNQNLPPNLYSVRCCYRLRLVSAFIMGHQLSI